MQEHIKKSIIGIALLFISAIVFGQKTSKIDPWFFIQITDPQFGMFENNEGFEQETFIYEKAVDAINKLNPDFVVITGDFVHNRNSEEQINEFKRITAMIDSKIPVYYTPGNHDVGQTPDEKSLEKYKDNYGPDRFSFTHKGSSFIGFNTSLIKAQLLDLERIQLTWLTQKLQESQHADHIILFCHYPFFIKTFDEPDSYSNITFSDRDLYLKLFDKFNVNAIFSGHLHNNAYGKYGEIQLVTTSALGKPLSKAPSGMRVIKIYENKIEHDFYGIDELPEIIEFR